MINETNTFRNDQYGFELDLPSEWSSPNAGGSNSPFGDVFSFGSTHMESFNIIVGRAFYDDLKKTEQAFQDFAARKGYNHLKLGEIEVGNKPHIWARYRTNDGGWAKKYIVVFDMIEFTMTAVCFTKNLLEEREHIWDRTVKTFRLISKLEQPETFSYSERMRQAHLTFEQGNKLFQARRYHRALEIFEKGKLISHEFPWNFLGASMTRMQMVATKSIPKEQYALTIALAEKDIQVCIQISPSEPDYQTVWKEIKKYKKKYPLT